MSSSSFQSSRIIIDIYDLSNLRVMTCDVHDKMSGNNDIGMTETYYRKDGTTIASANEAYGMNFEALVDSYFSNQANVVGEHTKIHIEKLTTSDLELMNRLFSNPSPYPIPDCISFTVDPSVPLTFLPSLPAAASSSSSSAEEEGCPICLEELRNAPVSYLSGHQTDIHYCHHKFHTECIRTYLLTSSSSQPHRPTCPLCRNELRANDIRSLTEGGEKEKE